MIKIVDFYSDWCSPCQRLKPILNEISEERDDVVIEYVNTEKEIERTTENHVSSLPTIIFEKDGKECERINGFVSKQKILDIIERC